MGIFSRRSKAPEQRASVTDPASADHWIVKLTDSLSRAGHDVSGDNAMRQTAVFACVRVLSETIASLPLYIYERRPDETKEPARKHYLWPLLHSAPNEWQTSLEFFELAVNHLCMRGNFYAFIERAGGKIKQLLPVHPDRITVKLKDKTSYELVYEYTDDNGKVEQFDSYDIWHLRGLSSDGFLGLSPIAMAKQAIVLSSVAEDHGVAYFRNGARASGVAKVPGILKEDAYNRLQESLSKSISGDNKFKVLLLEQGLEFTPITLNNEDSQYLETRQFQIEEIARLFRVPCILIGHPDKTSTYASAEQFMLSFVIHTIRPWLVRIEQSINKNLLADSERSEYFSKFKIEGLLRGDTLSRYQAYASARQARWMSANEIRALEDMNPIAGGDDYENPAIDTNKGGDVNAVLPIQE